MKKSAVLLSSLVTLLLTLLVAQIGCATKAEPAGGEEAASVDVEAKLVYYAIPW